MMKHDNTPKNDRGNDHQYNTKNVGNSQTDKQRRQSQARLIYWLMSREPMTRLQAGRIAGLVQTSNVCRLVDEWIRQGKAAIHHVGRCPFSNENGVEFITTDRALFPKPEPDLFTPPDQLPTAQGVKHDY
jgi:hypothetical protein